MNDLINTNLKLVGWIGIHPTVIIVKELPEVVCRVVFLCREAYLLHSKSDLVRRKIPVLLLLYQKNQEKLSELLSHKVYYASMRLHLLSKEA